MRGPVRSFLRTRWASIVAVLATLVLLAGCDLGGGPTCDRAYTNTTPGTTNTTTTLTGSILLTTDHSIYSPEDTITATLINHSKTEMDTTFGFGRGEYCPTPFGLERQVGTSWQSVDVCAVLSGHGDAAPAPEREPIQPGGSYQGVVAGPVMAPGTYRVVLPFSAPQRSSSSGGAVYSALIRFCTCAKCS
jgi:hypothetical protein